MADTSIFGRLKRLFSTDIIVRNVGGTNIKVADTNQIQTTGKYRTNSLMDRYTRLFVNRNLNIYNPNQNYQTLRQQLYSDYEAMDTDSIIASTLDIIADETTLKNEQGKLLTINSSDENIKNILNNLFYDILNIEFNLWTWVRQMCKYGDFFLKLEISEEFGVYNCIPYTVYNMARSEGTDKKNPAKVEFILDLDGLMSTLDPNYLPNTQKNAIVLDNYEVAHFRLLSDANYLPYGRSYIEPGRKVFKQLTLMEDAMLLHRITRAPEKRIFYVNVGSIPANEVEQFMQRTINTIKKTPYVDQQTGQYNMRYNMQNMLEDFYIPIRGNDTTTKIENLPGLAYDGVTDVSYLRDKLFAALKVPKAYFGYEGELQGKATLAAEDIRFARTVERIQRIVESELTKIALIHLYVQGYTGESLTNFEISLSTPSIIFEQERVALMTEKVNLVSSLLDTKLISSDWIYENIFKFSEDQYTEMRDLVREDAKRAFRIGQIENEGNDPAQSGETYGTPHDLATIYRANRDEEQHLPDGYNERKNPVGRPVKHTSIYGTHEDPLGGIDRLGSHGMKGGYPADSTIMNETKKTKAVYYKNQDIFKPKKINLFENTGNLLDESNIRDL